MKYKVGDKVKIRKDLIREECYDFIAEMEEYKGKDAIIKEINDNYYRLDIDNCDWSWTDEMLEGNNKEEIGKMKAIQKAWNDNLKLSKEDQWESKQDIIENYCPNSMEVGLDLKEPKHCPGEYDKETCIRCWNREVADDEIEQKIESTFDKLHYSSVEFCINPSKEEYLIESLKDNESIIFMRKDEKLTYNQIPEIIKWLQNVYDYCTELKNKINYADFTEAKAYMNEGFKAEFENEVYYIKDDELYCEDTNSAVALKLRAIESNEWILL